MKIVTTGDSITQVGTAAVMGWCYQVRDGLLAAGLNAEVIGAGQGGDTAALLLNRWAYDVEPNRPEWVTIGVGTNDCLNAVALSTYVDKLTQLVSKAEAQGAQVVLLTPPRYEAGGVLTLAHNEQLYPYVDAVRELAAGRPTVRLADVNAACLRTQAKLTVDGSHPNAAGHKVIAETVLAAWGVA